VCVFFNHTTYVEFALEKKKKTPNETKPHTLKFFLFFLGDKTRTVQRMDLVLFNNVFIVTNNQISTLENRKKLLLEHVRGEGGIGNSPPIYIQSGPLDLYI
jgi:hypothetical protein